MLQSVRCWFALPLLFIASQTASATITTFESTSLGGSAWRYDYEVTNDTLPGALAEFSIFFDLNLYANLRDASGPAGWDLLVIQPDPLLPDDGFFDALHLTSGIAPGATSSPFSITFDFLGTGTPGSQAFEIRDPATFDLLDAGVTTRREPPVTPVSEPGSLALLISALALALSRRPSRARH